MVRSKNNNFLIHTMGFNLVSYLRTKTLKSTNYGYRNSPLLYVLSKLRSCFDVIQSSIPAVRFIPKILTPVMKGNFGITQMVQTTMFTKHKFGTKDPKLRAKRHKRVGTVTRAYTVFK